MMKRLKATNRFDWIMSFLSAAFVGGLFLDGWAHTRRVVERACVVGHRPALRRGGLATRLRGASAPKTRVRDDRGQTARRGPSLGAVGCPGGHPRRVLVVTRDRGTGLVLAAVTGDWRHGGG